MKTNRFWPQRNIDKNGLALNVLKLVHLYFIRDFKLGLEPCPC